MKTRLSIARQRGVTLIEALVAMAVMAFGMLALVGVQSTLRVNADLAKQRAEATRIAEAQLEVTRSFLTVGLGSGTAGDYDSISNIGPVSVSPPQTNTTYTQTMVVTPQADGVQTTIRIDVKWKDRYGDERIVTLRSVLARAAPVLSGLVSTVKKLTVVGQRGNRHPTIPVDAVNLGNPQNESAFRPPASGSVAWVFNNVTGVITRVCTIDASGALTSCEDTNAQLLSGYVRFNLRGVSKDINGSFSAYKPVPGDVAAYTIDNSLSKVTSRCTVSDATASKSLVAGDLAICSPLSPAQAISPFDPAESASYALVANDSENPNWPALNLSLSVTHDSMDPEAAHTHLPKCFANAPATSTDAVAQTVVQYFCIIYPKASDGTAAWVGRSDLIPLGFSDGSGSPTPTPWPIGTTVNSYQVCRYTTSATAFAASADHPATYGIWTSGCTISGVGATPKCRPVTGNLINQNFLIIEGSKSCPTDTAVTAGNLVNSNTARHQP